MTPPARPRAEPDFGETDSSEWVAPAPVGGDTEEWSQVEDEQADADADSTGDEGEPESR